MRARYVSVAFLSVLSAPVFSWFSAPVTANTVVRPSSPYAVVSGVPWADSSGNLIQAHGGGIIKVGSAYYWIGQDNKNLPNTTAQDRTTMACYSSADLMHWDFVGEVLAAVARPGSSASPGSEVLSTEEKALKTTSFVLNRPRVLYNSSTHKYVMYVDVAFGTSPPGRAPADFQVAVATSSSGVCPSVGMKGYSFNSVFKPEGNPSGDIGLFKKGDGTAYLLSEDTGNPKGNTKCTASSPMDCSVAGLYIYQLSSNYLRVVAAKHGQFKPAIYRFRDYEAPAMFKANGIYYLLTSHKTGWTPNENRYTTAKSLTGPWKPWSDFDPSESNTDISQTTFVLPVKGSAKTAYIYMGDRWNGTDLGDSTYVWQPLAIKGSTVSLRSHDSWSINVPAGVIADAGEPYFDLANVSSGNALQADAGSPDQGALGLSGDAHQQWQVVGVNYCSSKCGTYVPHYKIVSRSSTISGGHDVALEVQKNPSGKSSIGLGSWKDTNPNQEWEIKSASVAAELQFVNVGATLALESTPDGASVIPDQGNPRAASQQWRPIETPPGYWAYAADGNVTNRGGAPFFGSPAATKSLVHGSTIKGIAVTADGNGYWLVGSDGTIYPFGDAKAPRNPIHIHTCGGHPVPFAGSAGDPGPAGGYWAFTACGGVANEAGAPFLGSPKSDNARVNDIVGMTATPDGRGYWLIGSNGSVYPFGDPLATTPDPIRTRTCGGRPVPFAGIAGDPGPAGGYWAFTACGGVANEAGAPFLGSLKSGNVRVNDIVGMAATADGRGYWLIGSNGAVYPYGDATSGTSATATMLNGAAGDRNM